MAMGTQAYALPAGLYFDEPVVYTSDDLPELIDINWDGRDDLFVGYYGYSDYYEVDWWEVTYRTWGGWVDGENGAQVLVTSSGGDETRRFNAGDLIGPGGTVSPAATETWLGYYYFYRVFNWLYSWNEVYEREEFGQFENNRGFLGFKFEDIYGDDYYGWLDVSINHRNYLDYVGALEIWGFGFETEPYTPIAAGDVPEPGTLMALAFGAAGVLGRRRRTSA